MIQRVDYLKKAFVCLRSQFDVNFIQNVITHLERKALLGLEDYSPADKLALELLMDSAWIVIERKDLQIGTLAQR